MHDNDSSWRNDRRGTKKPQKPMLEGVKEEECNLTKVSKSTEVVEVNKDKEGHKLRQMGEQSHLSS